MQQRHQLLLANLAKISDYQNNLTIEWQNLFVADPLGGGGGRGRGWWVTRQKFNHSTTFIATSNFGNLVTSHRVT